VYRNFASLEDFEGEIALLRALPSGNTPIATNSSNTDSQQYNRVKN